MSEIKLLPCPFCGGEATVNTIEPHKHAFATWMPDYTGGTFIECNKCSCSLSGETEEEAIEAWNTRKPMQEILERLEELREVFFYEVEADKYCQNIDDCADKNCFVCIMDRAIAYVKEVGEANERD